MEEVKFQNLYNHQRLLYKYFPISNEYAVKDKCNDSVAYLFTPNIAREDMEKKNEKEVIEKWRAIALDGMIFYTSPNFFNDPFDTVLPDVPQLVPELNERQEVIKALKSFCTIKRDDVNRLLYSNDFERAALIVMDIKGIDAEIQKEIQKQIRLRGMKYRNEIAISCFSETKDSKLMWAHYANSYTGFCIEYDFSQSRDIAFQKGIAKVRYTEKRPNLEKLDDYEQYVKQVVCTKSECWAYEKEWRSINILSYSEYTNRIYPIVDAKKCIKAIYLGCNMAKDYQEEIAEYYRGTNVNIYRMKLRKETFDFYFDDFYSTR